MPQSDPSKAWAYMISYWMFAGVIGVEWGYLGNLLAQIHHILSRVQKSYEVSEKFALSWKFLSIGLSVTLFARWFLDSRYDNFGRERHVGATLLFALFNGIFETIYFVFVYDCGKWIFHPFGQWMQYISGFMLYFLFSALVHVFFWEACVFPHHIKKNAKPFLTHGLPYLVLVSVVWFFIYEMCGTLFEICFCHFVIDAWASLTIALPSPFFREHKISWQTNQRLGWIFAFYYWIIGAYVGTKLDYISVRLRRDSSDRVHAVYHIVAVCMVTFATGKILHSRYDTLGRHREPVAIVVFAVLNGIFETFHFLSWYDLGRHALPRYLPLNGVFEHPHFPKMIGFGTFCIMAMYADLLFVGPLIMPPHIRRYESPETKDPFVTRGLIPSIFLSMGWMSLYESGDISSLIGLHIMMCIWSGYTMAYPSPFKRKVK